MEADCVGPIWTLITTSPDSWMGFLARSGGCRNWDDVAESQPVPPKQPRPGSTAEKEDVHGIWIAKERAPCTGTLCIDTSPRRAHRNLRLNRVTRLPRLTACCSHL